MVGEEITSLEALGIAIRSEIDAQEVYKDLASMCEEELMRDKFLNMHNEERKHQLLLEKMYKGRVMLYKIKNKKLVEQNFPPTNMILAGEK